MVLTVLATALATACGGGTARGNGSSGSASSGDVPVERLRVEVVAEHPHDPSAYTQGLQLLREGILLESTGLKGESTLREVDLRTGRVERVHDLAPDLFGEGVTIVEGRAVQLTWRNETAMVYDLDTFEVVDRWSYEGEGWGICHDGDRFVTSDGSATLTFRDTETFEPTGTVEVTLDGERLSDLNELECVDGDVYANVYMDDRIVEIDPATGQVVAVIDASGLDVDADPSAGAVLNGIAHDPATGNLLLTGKRWPTLFEVRLVPIGS